MTEVETVEAEVVVDDDFGADDYPITPHIPDGKYFGEIVKFQANDEFGFIKIPVLLKGNDGKYLEVINKQTGAVEILENVPVDGNVAEKMVWYPKPGEEKMLTASGKYTKKSWKIKQLIDTGKALGIELLNKNKARELMASQELTGLLVEVTVKTNEYNGKITHGEIAFINAVKE